MLNTYIQQITESLKPLNPYLVILFGSYAYGTPNKYSDLDVFVVLNDHAMPATIPEKRSLYPRVIPYFRPMAKDISVDLMVFTISMYEQFKTTKNPLAKNILNKGIKNVDIRMVDSDLHVFTRLQGRRNITETQRILQRKTFDEMIAAVKN